MFLFDDACPPVYPDPPQLVPVFCVVVGEHRHQGVLSDVAQPPQVGGRLRLVVHGRVNQVPVDRERARNQMRLPVPPSRRERGHPRAGKQRPGLFLGEPHPSIVVPEPHQRTRPNRYTSKAVREDGTPP